MLIKVGELTGTVKNVLPYILVTFLVVVIEYSNYRSLVDSWLNFAHRLKLQFIIIEKLHQQRLKQLMTYIHSQKHTTKKAFDTHFYTIQDAGPGKTTTHSVRGLF